MSVAGICLEPAWWLNAWAEVKFFPEHLWLCCFLIFPDLKDIEFQPLPVHLGNASLLVSIKSYPTYKKDIKFQPVAQLEPLGIMLIKGLSLLPKQCEILFTTLLYYTQVRVLE